MSNADARDRQGRLLDHEVLKFGIHMALMLAKVCASPARLFS